MPLVDSILVGQPERVSPTPSELIGDLRSVGVEVDDVWELVNSTAGYAAAVPVLLEWLGRAEASVPVYQVDKLKEGIVRALTVREARPKAAPALIAEMRRFSGLAERSSSGLPWALGNALATVADDTVFDDLVALCRDTSLGSNREMLTRALARSRRPEATTVLLSLLDDEAVAGHAVDALARRGDPAARVGLERFVDDRRSWVRNSARRGLKKLDAS